MVYGALLGLAGAGAGIYGQQQQAKALQGAQNQYQGMLSAFQQRQSRINQEFTDQYRDLSSARLNNIGGTLQAYMAPTHARQASDTEGIDQALAQVRGATAGQGGPLSGAAQGWGNAVQGRTNANIGRQREVAGDVQMLGRVGHGQNAALANFGVQEQRGARELFGLHQQEQLRQALLEQQFQQLNMTGQNMFNHAQGAGKDWMAIGGLAGTVGGAWDSYSSDGGWGQAKANVANASGPV